MRVQFLDTIIQLAEAELDQIEETWADEEMPLSVKNRRREVEARLTKYQTQLEYWRKAGK
jgi:nitrate/nitrite-specific signal transduction histidine kinase